MREVVIVKLPQEIVGVIIDLLWCDNILTPTNGMHCTTWTWAVCKPWMPRNRHCLFERIRLQCLHVPKFLDSPLLTMTPFIRYRDTDSEQLWIWLKDAIPFLSIFTIASRNFISMETSTLSDHSEEPFQPNGNGVLRSISIVPLISTLFNFQAQKRLPVSWVHSESLKLVAWAADRRIEWVLRPRRLWATAKDTSRDEVKTVTTNFVAGTRGSTIVV
jgi:hypothetical protein